MVESFNRVRFKKVTDLLAKTKNLVAEVGKRFLEIKNPISDLKLKTAKLDDLNNLISTQKTTKFQTRKLIDLKDWSRHFNTRTSCIPDDPAESEADFRYKVISDTFGEKKCKMWVGSQDSQAGKISFQQACDLNLSGL